MTVRPRGFCVKRPFHFAPFFLFVLLAVILVPPVASSMELNWEWKHPLPQGNSLRAVWGTAASNLFAVGHGGTIIHYNRADWSVMVSGTTEHLTGIWGASDTDVIAVGEKGTILHFDGTNWSAMTSGTTMQLNGVWGGFRNRCFRRWVVRHRFALRRRRLVPHDLHNHETPVGGMGHIGQRGVRRGQRRHHPDI